jgi:hypothetical protein
MALLFMDGFDSYTAITQVTNRGWLAAAAGGLGSAAFSATAGRFGGGAIVLNSNENSTQYYAYASKSYAFVQGSTYSIGVSVLPAQLGSGVYSSVILSSSSPSAGAHIGHLIDITSTGAILVGNGAAGVLATSAAGVISAAAWHWIEYIVNFSTTSSGSVQVLVDGVSVINYSGATLSAVGYLPTTIDLFCGFTGSAAAATITNTFDDFVLADTSGAAVNTFPLGPMRIGTLKPNSAVTSGFTPSTAGGPNYAMVNTGWASTTSVSDTGTGTADMYGVGALPWTPTTVLAVQVTAMAQTPSGARSLYLQAKLGAAIMLSGAYTLAIGAYATYSNTWYLDSAGAALTPATVAAASIGISD